MGFIASIPSPSFDVLNLGPFSVHVYGLMYVLAVAGAILTTIPRWEAKGGDRDDVYEAALWGFPAGLIGGRIYFVITSWNEVPDHWWGVFAVWQGGLGLWGGIAGGVIVGIWRLRRRGVNVPMFMDAAAPGLLVAQALGRVGNYFNQELFGGPTSLPWGLEIDREHRPDNYLDDPTFHPTFLYELLWDLSLAAMLVWLGRARAVRPPSLFAIYVLGYCIFRALMELLRVDPAHHILGLRLNFFVAMVGALAAAAWLAAIQRRGQEPSRSPYPGRPVAKAAARPVVPPTSSPAPSTPGRAGEAEATSSAPASKPKPKPGPKAPPPPPRFKTKRPPPPPRRKKR